MSRLVGVSFFLLSALSTVNAYSVDDASCSAITINTALNTNDISNAVQEALNMAEYGAFRLAQQPPTGSIVEDLLGINNRQTFISTMKKVTPALGQRTGGDTTVDIVCGTRYMEKLPNGNFRDRRFPNMQEINPPDPDNPNNDNFCPPGNVAYTMETGFRINTGFQPKEIIVLCDVKDGALGDEALLNPKAWSADWTTIDQGTQKTALEISTQFIIASLLHEFLHVVDPKGISSTLSNGDNEVYDLEDVLDLPDKVRSSNAESYVYLATGLYVLTHELNDDGSFTRLLPSDQVADNHNPQPAPATSDQG